MITLFSVAWMHPLYVHRVSLVLLKIFTISYFTIVVQWLLLDLKNCFLWQKSDKVNIRNKDIKYFVFVMNKMAYLSTEVTFIPKGEMHISDSYHPVADIWVHLAELQLPVICMLGL